jgi:Mg-chelatase subunit ChlD
MTMTRRHFLAAGLACGLLAAADGSVAYAQSLTGTRATRFRPHNVVVIVLDTSESFQRPSRERGVEGKVLFVEALGVVQRYLAEASKRRERRKEGEDQYFIVAADAASQLMWSG